MEVGVVDKVGRWQISAKLKACFSKPLPWEEQGDTGAIIRFMLQLSSKKQCRVACHRIPNA